MKEFWSGRIREMTPYVPGEQPRGRTFIKLNTNECPYPPSPRALEAVRAAAGDSLRLYPDPECLELRQTIARRYRLSENQVFMGNGSDEVLAFAFQAFFDPEREIVFPRVSYSFYPVYARYFGLRYRQVPMKDDLSVDLDAMMGDNGGVVIPNPNAPTGMALPLERIEALLRANPEAVVIVDEAYVDFGADSAVPLIRDYPNLLVVQTASKSRALAGLRVGWALGSSNLIDGLRCVRDCINSYTVDRVAAAGLKGAMEDEGYFQSVRGRVMATRDRTAQRLAELGFSVLPSRANFLFVSRPGVSGAALQAGLRERSILVRRWDDPLIADWLRITVGTDGDMDALLAALAELTA